jgi:hypothetical protein
MTSPARHADSLAEHTTHHVASIAAAFEHVVTEGVPALREPRPRETAHAVRTVELVAETIAGFAIGVVTGELVRGVRTWFGDELARAVRVIAAAAPARRVFGIAPARFLDDADDRPLVDELGTRLQPRLRVAVADARAIVERAIAALPEARARTTVAMIERLTAESLARERIGDELAHGWTYACAVIEGAPLPEHGNARSRELWRAWCGLAGAVEKRPTAPYIVAM